MRRDDLDPPVRGILHHPEQFSGEGLVLTHGAGSNCNSPLLVTVAQGFAARGVAVLRCDLPFRQVRPRGAPFPAGAPRDRLGLKNAVGCLRELGPKRIYLGGHSYGGRQATMLASEEPEIAHGLLLLSYPLHPPRKPDQLRTAHFPALRTPALFVHGARDPFGSVDEMCSALALVSARHDLTVVDGAAHDLRRADIASIVVEAFAAFTRER